MAITFDQPSVRQMMLSKIKDLAGQEYDALQFSTINLVLEAVAESISQLALYDEFLTRESAWETAENYYSLRAQLKTRGYKPRHMKGSTGYLIFSTKEEMTTSPTWNTVVTYELDDYVVYYNSVTDRVELYQSIHTNVSTPTADPEIFTNVDNNIGYPPSQYPAYWQKIDCRYFGQRDVIIPLGTSFSGAGLNFSSTVKTTLLSNEEYVLVPVKQGLRKSAAFAVLNNEVGAVGFPTAEISDRNIDQEFYFITIDGQEYSEVASIYEALKTDYAFEVTADSDVNTLKLIFGNGQFGLRPTLNQLGNIIYLETEGLSGEVLALNIVNVVKDTMYCYDELGQAISVTCYCTNPTTITGGYNGDTIAQIKSGAITAYQSQNRAITLTDYQMLLNEHPSVGNCLVWGEYEECKTSGQEWDDYILTNQNKIHVCGYTQAGYSFPTEVQEELLAFLLNKKSPMDVVVFEPVEAIGLIFNINAYVANTTYSLETVRQEILALLADSYSASILGFETPIYETAWKGKITQIDGVTYHDSSIQLSKEVGFDSEGTALSVTTQLPFNQINQESYEIWIRLTPTGSWVQIASMNNDQLVWSGSYAEGADTGSDQMDAAGNIHLSEVVLPAGTVREDVLFRIIYMLQDSEGNDILNFVPNRKNQIMNFIETRVLHVEYI